MKKVPFNHSFIHSFSDTSKYNILSFWIVGILVQRWPFFCWVQIAPRRFSWPIQSEINPSVGMLLKKCSLVMYWLRNRRSARTSFSKKIQRIARLNLEIVSFHSLKTILDRTFYFPGPISFPVVSRIFWKYTFTSIHALIRPMDDVCAYA